MKNITVFTAPEKVVIDKSDRFIPTVFLAGSIEMNKAENWQERYIKYLSKHQCVVFNPRRENWDSSWKQSIDNPHFSEQVNWELDRLAESDIIIFYIQPDTISPITLMELGKFAGSDEHEVLVYCPEGYFRKGNVDVLCHREGVVVHTQEDAFIRALDRLLERTAMSKFGSFDIT